MATQSSHCAEDEQPETVPANSPRAQLPFSMRLLTGWLIAMLVASTLAVTAGCQRAPSREPERDSRLADRFSLRHLPKHRLKQPIPVPEDERTDDLVVNPITPGGPTGPTPEVYWVTEMATGNPITSLTRHDDLMAAGTRGVSACVAWLSHRRDRMELGESPLGDAVRVIQCVRHMLASHHAETKTAGIPAAERAVMASALVPLTAEGQPRRQRLAAFDLLGSVYTANEAAVLASGLGVDDAVTNSRTAEALTVHLTYVARPPVADDNDHAAAAGSAAGSPRFITAGDWPTDLPPALAVRLTLRPETREVELVGLLDPATELKARTVSAAVQWQDAITRLAHRSRAALQAAEEVWHLLDHRDVTIRSRAAHCLRLMSGEFAGFRSTAAPLARQLAIARWSVRLVRLLPARRQVDQQTAR